MSTIRGDGITIPAGVGSGGTVHAGGGDIFSGFGSSGPGTVHVTGPDIGSGHGPSSSSIGVSINKGDPLVINSVTYLYQGVISKSTGEAEIFLLSQNGKKCVFKLYYPNFKPKEDVVKQLKQINHDDIINVLDYGYYHDRFFEIMDFAEGGTLDKYLPIKDVARIKQVVAEIINAFKFCHAHGIIHKDIKPQNIYCRNADGSDLLIGDFGISSLLETGVSRHLTSQSLTAGYAAPEMYGIGGKVYVGKEVDYYALGISIIHVWDGKNPFDDLNIHAISNLTTSGKVHIPGDMPREIQNLVKGLITVDYTMRWRCDEVERWLRGEDVPVHFKIIEHSYPNYKFNNNQDASSAEELAHLLKTNLDKGIKHLYSGKISEWVKQFNQGLAVDLDDIVEQDYPSDQDAGIHKAIYMLNPDEPFLHKSQHSGKNQNNIIACRTTEELANALEEGFEKYKDKLLNRNHQFFLYLEARGGKTEAGLFRKWFKTFSPKKALNKIIIELRGINQFVLGEAIFYNVEELLNYQDKSYLVKNLLDEESLLSTWLEQILCVGEFDRDKKSSNSHLHGNDVINRLKENYPNNDTVKYFDSLNEMFSRQWAVHKENLEKKCLLKKKQSEEDAISRASIDTKKIMTDYNKSNLGIYIIIIVLNIIPLLLVVIYMIEIFFPSNQIIDQFYFPLASVAAIFQVFILSKLDVSFIPEKSIISESLIIPITLASSLACYTLLVVFNLFSMGLALIIGICVSILLLCAIFGFIGEIIMLIPGFILGKIVHSYTNVEQEYFITLIGISIFSILHYITYILERKHKTKLLNSNVTDYKQALQSELEIIDKKFLADLENAPQEIWNEIIGSNNKSSLKSS